MIIIMSLSATTFALGLGIIVPISKDYATHQELSNFEKFENRQKCLIFFSFAEPHYLTLIWLNFGIIFNSVFTYLVCLHYQIVFIFSPAPHGHFEGGHHHDLEAAEYEAELAKMDNEQQICAMMKEEADSKMIIEMDESSFTVSSIGNFERKKKIMNFVCILTNFSSYSQSFGTSYTFMVKHSKC